MRITLATEKLVVEGRSFAGFPLLIDAGKPVEPAQTFLWDCCPRWDRDDFRVGLLVGTGTALALN
jgi:hypothetical protein